MHMAIGGLVNAAWDLRARREGRPLWQVLAGLTPAEIVELVDFTYIDDALTPEDALALLVARHDGKGARTEQGAEHRQGRSPTDAPWPRPATR